MKLPYPNKSESIVKFSVSFLIGFTSLTVRKVPIVFVIAPWLYRIKRQAPVHPSSYTDRLTQQLTLAYPSVCRLSRSISVYLSLSFRLIYLLFVQKRMLLQKATQERRPGTRDDGSTGMLQMNALWHSSKIQLRSRLMHRIGSNSFHTKWRRWCFFKPFLPA